ncbi:hypothetical protein [Nitrospira sp. Nam74]
MKALMTMLVLLASLVVLTEAWADEQDARLRSLSKNFCTKDASPEDTAALRSLIVQLTNYYNSTNDANQLKGSADRFLHDNIAFRRTDIPGGEPQGKQKYFSFVDYDFRRWTAHNMGTVVDLDDGGEVKFCAFTFDPDTLSTAVRYPFSFTPKDNAQQEKYNITATWNFTRAQGKNEYNWVMSFANIAYFPNLPPPNQP